MSSLASMIDFRLTEGDPGRPGLAGGRHQPAGGASERREPGRIPLILVHPIGGSVFCYNELAHRIRADQPVYALQAHAFIDEDSAPDTFEEMATEYLREIRELQPLGLISWVAGHWVGCWPWSWPVGFPDWGGGCTPDPD